MVLDRFKVLVYMYQLGTDHAPIGPQAGCFGLKGHNLKKFKRGPLDHATKQISRL